MGWHPFPTCPPLGGGGGAAVDKGRGGAVIDARSDNPHHQPASHLCTLRSLVLPTGPCPLPPVLRPPLLPGACPPYLAQAGRYAEGARRFEFDWGLAPYNLPAWQCWRDLTSCLDAHVIDAVQPVSGQLAVAAEAEAVRCVSSVSAVWLVSLRCVSCRLTVACGCSKRWFSRVAWLCSWTAAGLGGEESVPCCSVPVPVPFKPTRALPLPGV